MTREMNKPEWIKWRKIWIDAHNFEIVEIKEKPKERVLNPDIAEFFYQTNERLKK